MPLRVEADLVVEVDGATVTLRGEGRRLELEATSMRRLLGGAPRATIRRLSELLSGQGLTLDVVDASGPLVSLGAETSSRTGALLFATPRVALRRPLSLLWRLFRG